MAVTANSGTSPLSITIVRNILSDDPQVQQVPPGPATDEGVLASVFMGLAISPDNQTIYVAGGQENAVYLFDATTGRAKVKSIAIDKTTESEYAHGYIGDLVLSQDGKTLYAVDQIGFRVVVIDLTDRTCGIRFRWVDIPLVYVYLPTRKRIICSKCGYVSIFLHQKVG